MKKSTSLIIKAIICLISILVVVFINLSVPVFALSSSEKSLIILSDNGAKEDAKKIQHKFPEAKVYLINEINSLVVKDIQKYQISSIKQYICENLNIPSNDIVSNTEISVPNLKENIVNSKINTPLIAKETSTESYDTWMWDIKQVTDNYQSHLINKGSHNVKVGIIDSGIDFDHPDLKENIIDVGKSFVPNDTSTQDNLGHGTMVAGTIAANGKIKGIGPDLGIVPYKVFNERGGNSIWAIEAIIQATKDNMDVINLSLGTFKSIKNREDRGIVKAYQRAFKYAKKNNTIIVASSGNDGLNISNPKNLAEQLEKADDLVVHVPGGEKDVITVAATNREKKLSSYSNYGNNISISAPGGDYGPNFNQDSIFDLNSFIVATYPVHLPQTYVSKHLGFEQGYELTVGTSFAAPKVTATIAVMKDQYLKQLGKEMTVKEVEKNLYKNVDKPIYDKENMAGKGIVNANKVLVDLKTK